MFTQLSDGTKAEAPTKLSEALAFVVKPIGRVISYLFKRAIFTPPPGRHPIKKRGGQREHKRDVDDQP